MHLIIALLSILLVGNFCWAEQPTFQQQLWDVTNTSVEATTIKAYRQGSINVEEIYYQSRSYRDKPVKIFGYFCYPRTYTSKLPAILLVHGGGGSAHLGRTLAWARRGYAVLTIDLPGKGEQRAISRSTGPDMTVANLLQTKPDLSQNFLVHRRLVAFLVR